MSSSPVKGCSRTTGRLRGTPSGLSRRVELFASAPGPDVLERVGRFIQHERGYCVGAFDSLSLDDEGVLFVPEPVVFPPEDQRMLDVWFSDAAFPHVEGQSVDITFLRLIPLLPDERDFALKNGRSGGEKLWTRIQSPAWNREKSVLKRFFGLF
ncbi:MAG: hypothetical protein ACO1OB_11485 [Archangium sp.]